MPVADPQVTTSVGSNHVDARACVRACVRALPCPLALATSTALPAAGFAEPQARHERSRKASLIPLHGAVVGGLPIVAVMLHVRIIACRGWHGRNHKAGGRRSSRVRILGHRVNTAGRRARAEWEWVGALALPWPAHPPKADR